MIINRISRYALILVVVLAFGVAGALLKKYLGDAVDWIFLGGLLAGYIVKCIEYK